VRMRVLKRLSSRKKCAMSTRGTTLVLSSTKAVMMVTEPRPSSPRSPWRTRSAARWLREFWSGSRTREKTRGNRFRGPAPLAENRQY
jgi:hypothetical protein